MTHAHVAEVSGVGRRTMYRHWPRVTALLYDAMASLDPPHAPVTGDLRRDLEAHLRALADALAKGLAYTVCALGERAAHDETFEHLRRRLTDAGCRPAEDILRNAVTAGLLPADLDVPLAMAQLEGPVFYAGLVRRAPLAAAATAAIVDRLLAAPPTTGSCPAE